MLFIFPGLGWPLLWSWTGGTILQWLYIRLLRLPFPPFNGSPVNLNCLSGIVARGGSTLFHCAVVSATLTEQRFRHSIFAAHVHASGPNTSAFRLYSFFTCEHSSHIIFSQSLSLSLSLSPLPTLVPVGCNCCQVRLIGSGFTFFPGKPSPPPCLHKCLNPC